MDEITSKVCTRCGIDKDYSEFPKSSRNKSGIAARCKSCCSEIYYENHEERLEQNREYRQEHRIELNERKKKYHQENKEKLNKNRRDKYSADPNYRALCSQRGKAWRDSNLEYKVMKDAEYYRNNREDVLITVNNWVKNNHDRVIFNSRNRKHRKRNAQGSHTLEQLKEQWIIQEGCCFWCDYPLLNPFTKDGWGRKPHLDHVIPLIKDGSNYIENLVWACQPCNCSKSDKLPSEWEGSNGRWIDRF